jgi:RNA polymerase sigma-70 factor (ECF subfamily)
MAAAESWNMASRSAGAEYLPYRDPGREERQIVAQSILRGDMLILAWSLLVAVVWGRGLSGEPADRGQALRALYDLCSRKVMAVALRLLGDRAEAEDVVQETFLELWRRAKEYDPARADPTTWAIVIGRSRALDRLRARSSAVRAGAALAAEPMSADPAPEPAEAREEQQRVRAALSSLPSEQREVIELAYFDGLAQSEIAVRTGQPLGTVKTRVRLAMRKLETTLGGVR